MADPNHQPPSSLHDNGSSGVANSVVNDLMRVYESLTQSSTPQAEVSDVSKALNLVYAKSGSSHPTAASRHEPPTGYSISTSAFKQQQETTVKNTSAPTIPPSFSTEGGRYNANMESYQQQQKPTGYSGQAAAVSASDTNKDVSHQKQRSGEDSHTIMRTDSTVSRISHVSSQNLQQPATDASSESDRSTSGGRSKKKRKHPQNDVVSPSVSGGGKKSGRGKKSKKEDGRWSKRFTWPEDLHRDFVSAIFDVGLKHSSPSAIMEHMPKHKPITSERIKSHLQKYRLHRVKSKKEFISSYEASLRNFQNQNNSGSTLVSGSAKVAAHLTASTLANIKTTTGIGLKDDVTKNIATPVSSNPNHNEQQLNQSQNFSDINNGSLMLPQLTEAEKESPIGAAMGYLMGLFFSLKQQLTIQRSLEAAGEKARGNAIFPPSATAKISSGNGNIATINPTATAVAVAAGVEFVADSAMQQSQQQNGVGSTALRSNIEVNSMMKREMQNQMVIQNKMRALKQQELDKYKHISQGAVSASVASDVVMTTVVQDNSCDVAAMRSNDIERSLIPGDRSNAPQTHQEVQPSIGATRTFMSSQGAGEIAGTDMTSRMLMTEPGQAKEGSDNLMGIEKLEDFWNTDVVDDQLFEFLLNS